MTQIRKLDLNLVLVLDALLAEPSITQVSARLGMTSSAVNAALARLRELLDDPIIQRAGRSFALTAPARALVPEVAACMAEVDRIFDVLPSFDPATSTRTFRIAASDYPLTILATPFMRVLHRAAPGTHVRFEQLPSTAPATPEMLLRHDLMIAATGRGVPGKRESLFSDRFVCVADAANPAIVDGGLSHDALGSLAHVATTFGTNTSTPIEDVFTTEGITARVALTVPGFMPVLFAVAGTDRIGFVPERIAQRCREPLGLAIVDTSVSLGLLIEAAYWHPSKSDDPALDWLLRQLRIACKAIESGVPV